MEEWRESLAAHGPSQATLKDVSRNRSMEEAEDKQQGFQPMRRTRTMSSLRVVDRKVSGRVMGTRLVSHGEALTSSVRY